jgi:hypothetical protein
MGWDQRSTHGKVQDPVPMVPLILCVNIFHTSILWSYRLVFSILDELTHILYMLYWIFSVFAAVAL